MKDKVSELNSLAEKALQGQGDISQQMEAIEEYCAAFGQSFSLPDGSLDVLSPTTDDEREAVSQLEQTHRQVLLRAEQLISQTSKELRDLKTKGKGLMAYLDILPKKISVTRSRKG